MNGVNAMLLSAMGRSPAPRSGPRAERHGGPCPPSRPGLLLSAMVSKSLNMLPVIPETRSERPRAVGPSRQPRSGCYCDTPVTASPTSETPCFHGGYGVL